MRCKARSKRIPGSYAIAVATAIEAIDADGGGDILHRAGARCPNHVRAPCRVAHRNEHRARQPRVRSARARERFRKAIIAAFGRYGRVRSFATVRELISAARAPQCEERPLLH